MEQALEGGDSVHRVKRGRPAKAVEVVEAPAVVAIEAPVVSKAVDMTPMFAQTRLNRRINPKSVEELSAVRLRGCDPKAAAYAARVWNGQSPDLPVAERIERVMNALRGQNLLTTGLTFPPLPEAA